MKRLIATIFALILTISLCPALAEYTDSETILAVQEALADAGIYKGNLSGIKGNATENAIRTYQQKNGLKVNGQIDDELLDSLGLLSDEVILVSKITLNEESVSLGKGGTVTLTATVEPKNARNKKVEWSSTDESVATVKDGKVTAKANGACDIVCRAKDDSGVEAVCHVAVIVMVTSVTTTQNQKVTIPYGGSVELTATAKPADATNTTLKWSSSDESVCVIDENGKVTSVGSGDCEIECSATDGSKKSIKFQIHVPIFEELEATYTIAEKGWNLIPIDLHGTSAGNISHSVSSEKFFMYYFDNEGIHIYPIADGNAKIALTSKLNKQDKMTVSVNIEKAAAYADEEEPLSVAVALDKNEIKANDTVNMRYRVSGGRPPYKIFYQENYVNGANAVVSLTSSSGTVALKPISSQYERISIAVIDSLGTTRTEYSNTLFIYDVANLSIDCDYIAVVKGTPFDINYSITGGNGKYRVFMESSYKVNEMPVVIDSRDFVSGKTGNFHLVAPDIGDWLSVNILFYDLNNIKIASSKHIEIMLTDDWSAKVMYNTDSCTRGEEIVASLYYDNHDQSYMPSLIMYEKDFDQTAPQSKSLGPWNMVDENTYSITFVSPECKLIDMSYWLNNIKISLRGKTIIIH